MRLVRLRPLDSAMTAEETLLEAYKDWRRLAELETEAIRTRHWILMADCQKRLASLQPIIIRLTADAREEWKKSNADKIAKQNELRAIISGLVELELQNSTLLAAAKDVAQTQLAQLELARTNLKRIQRSYGPIRPAVWNSLS